MNVTVCTIVRGRELHLNNLGRSLSASNHPIDRWVVIGMDEEPRFAPERPGLPIETVNMACPADRIPLAEARNAAAAHAASGSDLLVFLDVDCLAGPDMITAFDRAMTVDRRLWMGNVGYLPKGTTPSLDEPFNFDSLDGLAKQHPLLPKLSAGQTLTDAAHHRFWSLCFAIHRDDFGRVGGFDESYQGYGGEDTDFAFVIRDAGIDFGFVGARALHQHHGVCKPPLNHFDAIVANARRFREKWGVWPMESWLSAFDQMGLIQFDPMHDGLVVHKRPTLSQIENARSTAAAGF